MRKEILRIEGVNKSFSGEHVLKNVSFSLFTGEVFVVLGANSAGKTTLMRILAGALPMDSGSIYFMGRRVQKHSIAHARELGIQLVYDYANVIEDVSLSENIFLSFRKPAIYNPKRYHASAEVMLKKVNLEQSPDTLARELSVSERSKLKLAGALAAEPKLLILDEPPIFDSFRDKLMLKANIDSFKALGHSVIFITHNLNDALLFADRIMILRDGSAVFLEDRTHLDKQTLVSVLSQGNVSGSSFDLRKPSEEVALSAKGFSGKNFLPMDLTVRKGEVLGLIGSVDSGNIDVLRCLFGLKPYEGSIAIDGTSVTLRSPRQAVTHGISFSAGGLARDYGLVPTMSIAGNYALRIIKKLTRIGFINRLLEKHFAETHMKYLYTDAVSDVRTRVRKLSNGVKHKLQISECFSVHPKLLLLYEPTAGMDIPSKQRVLENIISLAESGAGVILAGAIDDDEMLSACHRVIVLSRGAVKGELRQPDIRIENIIALEQS